MQLSVKGDQYIDLAQLTTSNLLEDLKWCIEYLSDLDSIAETQFI